MRPADFDDVRQLFPAADDLLVADVLSLAPSLDELEAVAMLLAAEDTGLSKMQRTHGATMTQLLKILERAHLQPDIEP